jgi:hypothetical protein
MSAATHLEQSMSTSANRRGFVLAVILSTLATSARAHGDASHRASRWPT